VQPPESDFKPLVARPTAPDADVVQGRRRNLATFLSALGHEREPGTEQGAVALPEWPGFRAVVGGVLSRDLEGAYKLDGMARQEASASVSHSEKFGTHLPRGVHVVTGHTGGGKSAMAMNLAHAAIRGGHPVVYASLELDAEEIAARLLALESGLPWSKLYLRRPLGSDADKQRRADGIASLTEAIGSLFHVWAPDAGERGERATARDLREEVLAVWREHKKTPLVIFDYLQAPGFAATKEDGNAPLRERIAAVTMQLRHLSRRIESEPDWHGCPVVVLSITARANVRGADAERGMDGVDPDELRFANLEALKALPKEAGEVEATSVTSWVIAIESTPKEPMKGTRLAMRLVKNRLGPVGHWLPFRFHGASGRLEEDAGRYSTAGTESEAEKSAKATSHERGTMR
jgi:hypothetical protein